ncbi:hypothetical protein, partial [Enterococcus faecium]|uniref:hypothetical protein n=1 Tax=Enterococcus faecium TaxID=1352 RepID=UPI003F4BF847
KALVALGLQVLFFLFPSRKGINKRQRFRIRMSYIENTCILFNFYLFPSYEVSFALIFSRICLLMVK